MVKGQQQEELGMVMALLLLAFSSSTLIWPANSAQVYNVITYGAKADGKTDSGEALMAAWAGACGSVGKAATVYVPKGRFLVGKVTFRGPCKTSQLIFRIDGSLVVAPSDYGAIASSGYWIYFQHVNGLTLSGGTIDGGGASLWSCKANSSSNNCPSGATSVGLLGSQKVVISGLRSVNSQLFHIAINGCDKVRVNGVRISAPGDSPNTDGIHVQYSTAVTIVSTRIGTADDCVSIGPGTRDLWIENVVCGPGHGISIGSLGKQVEEAGVQNVTVRMVNFVGTQNGVRIKSWGRPSNGFVRDVLFQHLIVSDVQNPVIIDQNYCPDHHNCPTQESGIKISNVRYEDIHGTSATAVAVKLECSKTNPCSGITMEDVSLTYNHRPAEASCTNAAGTASGSGLQVQPLISC